jgi:hypothetical protein
MITDHVSQSQLDMWQRCPRQWKYRYVDGLKIPPGGALIEGRCYHKSLEVNFTQKIKTQTDLPLEDCLDAFSTEWSTALSEVEAVNWEEKRPEAIKNEGHSLVAKYITEIAPVVQPALVEEWYVSDVAGVTFVMRVDMVNDVGTVVDHKTSGKSYNQADVDKDMQASAAAFSLGRAILFENHVAVKSTNPRIQIVETVRTREDINWWLDASSAIVLQMKSGIAPPRPTGWWCSPNYCGYYNICRGGLLRKYY